MTEPDQAVIARLSSDFAAMAAYLARASVDLRQLERIVTERPLTPVVPTPPMQWQPPVVSAPAAPPRPPSPAPAVARPSTSRSDGWIASLSR